MINILKATKLPIYYVVPKSEMKHINQVQSLALTYNRIINGTM